MESKLIAKDAFWSVIAPAVTSYAMSIEPTAQNLTTAILFVLLVFFFIQYFRLRKNNVGPYLAETLGISSEEGNNDAISVAKESAAQFYFLGISGNRTVNNTDFERAIVELARRGGDVRFLLLSPKSRYLNQRAQDESASPQTWIHDINATANRLQDIANRNAAKIQVRYYDSYPYWRMLIVDRRKINLNYYLDRSRFTDSPQIVLQKTKRGMLDAYLKIFDNLWSAASETVT
jgi:hypothetical protein